MEKVKPEVSIERTVPAEQAQGQVEQKLSQIDRLIYLLLGIYTQVLGTDYGFGFYSSFCGQIVWIRCVFFRNLLCC